LHTAIRKQEKAKHEHSQNRQARALQWNAIPGEQEQGDAGQ